MSVWIPNSIYRGLPFFYMFSALLILSSEPVLGTGATFLAGIGLFAYSILVTYWRLEA